MLSTVMSALGLFLTNGSNSNSGECYDFALVGRILDMRNFVDLNDIMPSEPDVLYFGGSSEVLVQRDAVLEGNAPKLSWMSVTLTGLPKRMTKLLLLAKKGASDVPEIVHLEFVPARSRRQHWRDALQAASTRRCAG